MAPILYTTEEAALKAAWRDYLDSTVFGDSHPMTFDGFVNKVYRGETNFEVNKRTVFSA